MVFGVVSGSYLIVATLGFALVSRTEKFLNVAHAELILAGAFVTYWLSVREGWPLVLAAVTAVVAIVLLALVVGRAVYWPMRRSGAVVLLIVSVGVVYILHGVLETAVKPGVYTFDGREHDPARRRGHPDLRLRAAHRGGGPRRRSWRCTWC